MFSVLKRGLYVSVQIFLIVVVALIVTIFGMLPREDDGEVAVMINIAEAWKHIVGPPVKSVLLIFSILSVLRAAVIFLVYSSRKHIG